MVVKSFPFLGPTVKVSFFLLLFLSFLLQLMEKH